MSVAVGVPTIVFPQEPDLVPEAEWFEQCGAIVNLGYDGGMDMERVRTAVTRLLSDRFGALEMAERGRSVVDGLGAQRAADASRRARGAATGHSPQPQDRRAHRAREWPMATAQVMPALPAGFELDAPAAPQAGQGSMPPLPDGFELDGAGSEPAAPAVPRQPDTQAANTSFANNFSAVLKRAAHAVAQGESGLLGAVGTQEGRVGMGEVALNQLTGMFGSLMGATAAVGVHYGLGDPRDPQDIMNAVQAALTYQPRTQAGQKMADVAGVPMQALSDLSVAGGQKAADVTGSAATGAIVQSAIQVLPQVLGGELVRRFNGQAITADDMSNAAKVIAGKDAPPAAAAAVDQALRKTYEGTGIGPYTVLEQAMKDAGLRDELTRGQVPGAFEQFLRKPGDDVAAEPTRPGDGEPLLPQSRDEVLSPDQETPDGAPSETPPAGITDDRATLLRALGEQAFWAQEGGKLLRSGIPEPGDGGMGGAVTGRTGWIPASEWFGIMRQELGRSGLTSQEAIKAAIEKHINGEPLRPIEQRTIDWITREADHVEQEAAAARADDPQQMAQSAMGAGLTHNAVSDLDLVARAAELDPDAVERAAIQFENDDAGFMDEIRRIHAQFAEDDTGGDLEFSQAIPADARAAVADGGQGLQREEAPASAGQRTSAGGAQLNAGFDPTQYVRAFADGYTPFVGVETLPGGAHPGAASRPTACR